MMMDMNQVEKHLSTHPMLEEEKDTEIYLTRPLVSANLIKKPNLYRFFEGSFIYVIGYYIKPKYYSLFHIYV